MFRQLAPIAGGIPVVMSWPPATVARRLEQVWASRIRGARIGPVGAAVSLAASARDLWIGNALLRRPVIWDHLIYAYMLEQSGLFDAFERVVREYATDERIGIARQAATYDWLRSTEQIFFSYGNPFYASGLVSQIRPDQRATRRNAYYRMFGMDLNHGSAGGGPYPYHKAAVANRDFVTLFETFLREAWAAIENVRTIAGPNPTDPTALANLALRLQNMLNERRGGAATDPVLSREEFNAVATMSWFHLAVSQNTAVVMDLQATSASPEERLRRIGERVGVPIHANSHSYFILATRMSRLLLLIESGLLSSVGGATRIYFPRNANTVRDNMMAIIDHWSRVTGRNMKAKAVTPTPQLVAAQSRPITSPVAGNGAAGDVSARQLARV